MEKVKTRFAPSPTGYLHIGGLRTALYSYAFAKSQNGKFVLRIEDTDQDRVVPGAAEKIYQLLRLFGLNWDEGPEIGGPYAPYIQSERVKMGIYQKYAQKLVEEGHAYYCFCPPKPEEEIKESHLRKEIELRDPCRDFSLREAKEKLSSGEKAGIRLRVPEKEKISFFDFVVKKEISWETDHIDEVMLLKSDGFPTYHLAVVVDDALMEITHVLRGHDWLPSTPVHLLLYQYLGFTPPQIGHLTDILDPQGGKLSKRKGSVACEEFLTEGYLPQAILNFVMLLGWAPKDNREIFSLEEFVKYFPKGELQTSNPVFNRKKLDWFNGYYIRQLSLDELSAQFRLQNEDFAKLDKVKQNKITKLIQERIVKITDFNPLAGFLFKRPAVNVNLFENLPYKDHLREAIKALLAIQSWDNTSIQNSLLQVIERNNWKTGDFFMSFRIALSGSRFTPPITNCAEILGKEETISRLKSLIDQ